MPNTPRSGSQQKKVTSDHASVRAISCATTSGPAARRSRTACSRPQVPLHPSKLHVPCGSLHHKRCGPRRCDGRHPVERQNGALRLVLRPWGGTTSSEVSLGRCGAHGTSLHLPIGLELRCVASMEEPSIWRTVSRAVSCTVDLREHRRSEHRRSVSNTGPCKAPKPFPPQHPRHVVGIPPGEGHARSGCWGPCRAPNRRFWGLGGGLGRNSRIVWGPAGPQKVFLEPKRDPKEGLGRRRQNQTRPSELEEKQMKRSGLEHNSHC